MTSKLAVGLQPRVLWLVLAAWTGLQIVVFHGVRSDDAFISYRYGQNLAQGAGLVFNPGERILGSTSPGHMLLSAAVFALAGPEHTPDVMSAIGCVAWSAQAVALFMLLAPVLGHAAVIVSGAVLLGATGAAAWVPLETHLTAAAVLFAFAWAVRQRWYPALACAALASWCRPDALVAGLLLAGWCCWERRRGALGPLSLFIALFAPWILFASIYYGSPLPQSAVAKFHRSEASAYLLHELAYPGRVILPPAPVTLQIILLLVLTGLGTYMLARRAPRLLLLAAYGCSHAAAYLYLRPFTVHTWHLYPWTLVLCVLCFAGVIGLAQTNPDGSAPSRRRLLCQLVGGLACAGLIANAARGFIRDAADLADSYWCGQRQATYRDIAQYLGTHALGADRFASIEVGTIAFYSGLSAFDLGALITRVGDRMERYQVRFIVLDRAYMPTGIRARELYRSQHGEFLAVVYGPEP